MEKRTKRAALWAFFGFMMVAMTLTSCQNDDTKVAPKLTEQTLVGTWETIGYTSNVTIAPLKKTVMVEVTMADGVRKSLKVDGKEMPKEYEKYLQGLAENAMRLMLTGDKKFSQEVFSTEKKAWEFSSRGTYVFDQKAGTLTLNDEDGTKGVTKPTLLLSGVLLLNMGDDHSDDVLQFSDVTFTCKRIK